MGTLNTPSHGKCSNKVNHDKECESLCEDVKPVVVIRTDAD